MGHALPWPGQWVSRLFTCDFVDNEWTMIHFFNKLQLFYEKCPKILCGSFDGFFIFAGVIGHAKWTHWLRRDDGKPCDCMQKVC